MDIETKFIEAMKDYGKETDLGNSRKINSAFDKITKMYLKIKENEEQLKAILNKYLDDENDYVSYNCATFLLEYEPLKSENKLEQLVLNGGFCGFDAKITLKEWRKGALKFPPY